MRCTNKEFWVIKYMEPEPDGLRYEIKMEQADTSFPVIKGWINLHSAGFAEAFPPRQVNNIYYDTLDMDTFNDHLEGVPLRRKLRYRWYGVNPELATGQLEIKNKKDRVGWKVVQPIGNSFNLKQSNWTLIYQKMVSESRGIFYELLAVSRPLIINHYWREYYQSADQRIRVTLDYKMKAFDQWLSARPNLIFLTPLIDLVIIELKSPVEYAAYLADMLSEFPLRANCNSKFVNALDTLVRG